MVQDFKWFDVRKILGHNALINFIIGARGIGKTYSTKANLIKRFREKGEKFIFMKRSDRDVMDIAPRFFKDFCDENTDIIFAKKTFWIGHPVEKSVDTVEKPTKLHQFTVKETMADGNTRLHQVTQGREGWEYEEFGYSVGLRTTASLKGMPYDNVTTIVFDEFTSIANDYLPDEFTRILDVMETVFRMREDVRVILLGNATGQAYCPIFYQIGCEVPNEFEAGKIYKFKNGEILITYLNSEEYQNIKARTRMGKVSKGTDYFDNMIINLQTTQDFAPWLVENINEVCGLGSDLLYFLEKDGKYFQVHKQRPKRGPRLLIFPIRVRSGKPLPGYPCYSMGKSVLFAEFPNKQALRLAISTRKVWFEGRATCQTFFDWLRK